MKLKNLHNKIGFTKTEFNVLLVLVSVFILGFSIKVIRYYKDIHRIPDYKYSYSDSLFYSSGDKDEFLEDSLSEENKSLNYKKEVLEFNNDNANNKVSKVIDGQFVNINSANLNQLITLPGVGEKTANGILELRNKKGRFSSIEELKEVKGIGKAKFEKLKKYIIIE